MDVTFKHKVHTVFVSRVRVLYHYFILIGRRVSINTCCTATLYCLLTILNQWATAYISNECPWHQLAADTYVKIKDITQSVVLFSASSSEHQRVSHVTHKLQEVHCPSELTGIKHSPHIPFNIQPAASGYEASRTHSLSLAREHLDIDLGILTCLAS